MMAPCLYPGTPAAAATNYSIEIISTSTQGAQGVGSVRDAWMSADGRYVAFSSESPALAPNDSGTAMDIFVRDTMLRTTERISNLPDGTPAGGDNPFITPDGRFVAFDTTGRIDLADTNGTRDVYVFDRTTGQMVRGSVSSSGTQSQGTSRLPRLSADGRYLVFQSDSPDLAPGDSGVNNDAFLRDLATQQTTRLSNGAGLAPQISRDGRYVYFSTAHSGINSDPSTSANTNGVYLDRQTGATKAVPDGSSLSGDGLHLAYAVGYTDWEWGWVGTIYVQDMLTGAREGMASGGGGGEYPNFALSYDGRYFMLASSSDLTPNAGQGRTNTDVYVRDRSLGYWMKASTPQQGGGYEGVAFNGAIADDGRSVVFASYSTSLTLDTNTGADFFKSTLTPPSSPRVLSPSSPYSQDAENVTLSGTADPGTKVIVLENVSQKLGSTTTDQGGSWTLRVPVSDGTHQLDVREENQAFVRSDPARITVNVAAMRRGFAAPYSTPVTHATACKDNLSIVPPGVATNHATGSTGSIGVTATTNVFPSPTGAVVPFVCQGVGGASSSSDSGFEVSVPLTGTGTYRLDVTMTVSATTSVRIPLAPYGYWVGNSASAFMNAQATLGVMTCTYTCYISSVGYNNVSLANAPGYPSTHSGQLKMSVELVVPSLSGSSLVGTAGLIASSYSSGWSSAAANGTATITGMSIVKSAM